MEVMTQATVRKGITLITLKRQYIDLGQNYENGIVAVTAYGVIESITVRFALRGLQTKNVNQRISPQQARKYGRNDRELKAMGFRSVSASG